MLRRAENVTLYHVPGFWTKKGPAELTIGSKVYLIGGKMTKDEYAALHNRQWQFPIFLARIGGKTYWQFQNKFYWENEGLKADEIHALLVTREQRRRQQIDRAQATVAIGSTPRGAAAARRAIPDDLKQYVWIRDGGRCQNCGATTELQYDHIIPLAMGGSSNAENLQLLCGPCNRSKSAGLTTRRR
jgi:hypothetical protein